MATGDDDTDENGNDHDYDWLQEGHKTVLTVLYDVGEGTRSSQIRKLGNIPEGSLHHFLRPLREQGLVEVVGEEEVAGGASNAALYALTERGQEATADVLGRRPKDLSGRLHRLESDMDDVNRKLDQLQDTMERINDRLDEVEELPDRFKKLKTYVGQELPGDHFDGEGEFDDR